MKNGKKNFYYNLHLIKKCIDYSFHTIFKMISGFLTFFLIKNSFNLPHSPRPINKIKFSFLPSFLLLFFF